MGKAIGSEIVCNTHAITHPLFAESSLFLYPCPSFLTRDTIEKNGAVQIWVTMHEFFHHKRTQREKISVNSVFFCGEKCYPMLSISERCQKN
jgi:hypothetical protein